MLLREGKVTFGGRKIAVLTRWVFPTHSLFGFSSIGEEFVRLSSFVAINKLAIDKIIKKHDKHAAFPFRDVFPFFLQERALLHTSFFDSQVRPH